MFPRATVLAGQKGWKNLRHRRRQWQCWCGCVLYVHEYLVERCNSSSLKCQLKVDVGWSARAANSEAESRSQQVVAAQKARDQRKKIALQELFSGLH